MQSLLRWSIENTDTTNPHPQVQPKKLDPGIIDHILGKPDAVQMKEALAIAQDVSRSEEERVLAMDEFEMLVEQIDNANDLEKLQMWQPLQDLLISTTSPPSLKTQVLWVLGTAVQNNPAAQNAYLNHHPLPILLPFLSPSPQNPTSTRRKALYTLSGLLKHSSIALTHFSESGGWSVLKASLEDSDIQVRRKAVFLLGSLLLPSSDSGLAGGRVEPVYNPSAQSTSTALTLHEPTPPPTLQQQNSGPIHPNSHATMLSDPSSTDTASLTLRALQESGEGGESLLDVLIRTLVQPTPYGMDGEDGLEGDEEFEEKVVGVLYTYVITHHAHLTASQKAQLGTYFDTKLKEGGEGRWGLSEGELRQLLGALR
ncbi:hypothetical protein JAAARDRAFT_36768 [Jaapia argillacea MUCL 33604]|uniref:Nucleotide exchange factor Fes1 domain-containing protein n=1 Tax=Jaapia argillacea MUCL 33604 TaxID=933084 RepID=A0A067PXJ2_9AGAM|nr:hypothetical protein JAAARDRAFT_36768 [Jaapia argillacea MUCL 33604]